MVKYTTPRATLFSVQESTPILAMSLYGSSEGASDGMLEDPVNGDSLDW